MNIPRYTWADIVFVSPTSAFGTYTATGTKTSNEGAEMAEMKESKPPVETVITESDKPAKVKVRVKVNRNPSPSSYYIPVEINSNHKVPAVDLVVGCLAAAHRKEVQRLNRTHGRLKLEDCIWYTRDTIKAPSWTKAITDATIRALSPDNTDEMTIETSRLLNDAYLASGDQLYRLSITGLIGTNKALATVRKRAVEAGKSAAAIMEAKAKAECDALVKRAQDDSYKIYEKALAREAEIKKLADKYAIVPPEWVRSTTPTGNRIPVAIIPSHSHKIHIGFHLALKIKKFTFTRSSGNQIRTKEWDAVPRPDVNPLLWVPITPSGVYNITSTYCDRNMYNLPHVTLTQLCAAPGDAPAELNSIDAYTRLWMALCRTFSVVVLDSLLSHYAHWANSVKEFVPPVLVPALVQENYKTALDAINIVPNTPGQRLTTTSFETEGRETWTVDPATGTNG